MTTHPDTLYAIERLRNQERQDAVSRRSAAQPLSRIRRATRHLVPRTASAIGARGGRGKRHVRGAGEAA